MVACVVTALALTTIAMVVPDVLGVSLLLPVGREVVIWSSRSRALAGAGFLLWALSGWFAWRSRKYRARSGSADALLVPLTFLPLSLVGFLLRPLVPQAAAANLLFFLPVFLTATALFRWLQKIDSNADGTGTSARNTLVVGVGFWMFYALVGWYFTISMVKPPGDTGHYLLQTESLYRDHDLDLRNNLGVKAEKNPQSMHISRFSRGGHLYSWHSFGLPVLLAPFVPGGAPARHLILGLFAGLCCAGLWELCRLFGARTHWSLTVILLFALSRYWGIYSSLALPEVAGAALTIWGVVAILRQRTQPWGSGWVCVACCAYLPWLHTRFAPVSIALVGLYVLFGLLQRDPRRRVLLRLGVVTAAYGTALAGFFAFQLTMFAGGLPLPPDLFFAYPLGMWYGVAHRLGLLSVLPLFAAMTGAAALILVRDAPNRRASTMVLVLTGIVLVSSSTAPFWYGGDCFPGRYLVVVAPLFVPCLARALELMSPVARWWVIVLGLIPCFQFVLVLLGLPEMGDVSLLYDRLNGLNEYLGPGDSSPVKAFALVLLFGTGILLFLDAGRRRLAQAVAAAMILVAVAAGEVQFGGRLQKFQEKFNSRRLAELGPRLEGARIQTRGDLSALELFRVSNRYHRDKLPAGIDQGAAPIESNDWAGRGYRWVTLVPPFAAGTGWRACRLSGRLTGGAAAHWAVREGADTLLEEPLAPGPDGTFAITVRVPCRGRGQVVVAVRFEEDRGTLENPVVAWTPFSRELLEKGGFRL